MSTAHIDRPAEELTTYVAHVRAALDDLDPAVVQELTADLEADLADAQEDPGAAERPPASAYAAELRQAAGLPSRGTMTRPSVDPPMQWSELRRHPAARTIAALTTELAPVWWVIRGAGLSFPVLWLLGLAPRHPLGLLLLVLGAAASVWWARRPRARVAPSRGRTVGEVAAGGLALLFLCGWYLQVGTEPEWEQTYIPAGLAQDGMPIGNIYGYAPDGSRIDGVRLYDDRGQELTVESIAPSAESGVARVFPTTDSRYPTPWTPPSSDWHPPVSITPLPDAASASATTPPDGDDSAPSSPPSSRGEAPTPSSRGEAPTPSSRGEAPTPSSRGEAPTPSSTHSASTPSPTKTASTPSSTSSPVEGD